MKKLTEKGRDVQEKSIVKEREMREKRETQIKQKQRKAKLEKENANNRAAMEGNSSECRIWKRCDFHPQEQRDCFGYNTRGATTAEFYQFPCFLFVSSISLFLFVCVKLIFRMTSEIYQSSS